MWPHLPLLLLLRWPADVILAAGASFFGCPLAPSAFCWPHAPLRLMVRWLRLLRKCKNPPDNAFRFGYFGILRRTEAVHSNCDCNCNCNCLCSLHVFVAKWLCACLSQEPFHVCMLNRISSRAVIFWALLKYADKEAWPQGYSLIRNNRVDYPIHSLWTLQLVACCWPLQAASG